MGLHSKQAASLMPPHRQSDPAYTQGNPRRQETPAEYKSGSVPLVGSHVAPRAGRTDPSKGNGRIDHPDGLGRRRCLSYSGNVATDLERRHAVGILAMAAEVSPDT